MTKQDIEIILEEVKDLVNLPNNKLISLMDKLSTEFDETKNSIIDLSYHLDNVEALYNKILNEYEKRSK
jgi:hypothetical protein